MDWSHALEQLHHLSDTMRPDSVEAGVAVAQLDVGRRFPTWINAKTIQQRALTRRMAADELRKLCLTVTVPVT